MDSTKEMLGTFSPQAEPYTYLTPEETTPSGIFARGSYSARTKVALLDGWNIHTPLCSVHLRLCICILQVNEQEMFLFFIFLLQQFVDDDRKCYLEMNYTFDIRRDWTST